MITITKILDDEPDEPCVCNHMYSDHLRMGSQCSLAGCLCVYFITWDEADAEVEEAEESLRYAKEQP